MNRNLSSGEEACAERLWREAGFDSDPQATPLAGGANNRVFRLWGAEQSALLKVYYRGADDPRDRCGAELAFSHFLQQHGATAAPRPLAWDREAGMALFEFIDGRKLTAGEVTNTHVLTALKFIVEINQHRDAPGAAQLPNASEACFSIAEHLSCVDDRLRRLGAIGDASAIECDAQRFVVHELAPAWERVREHIAGEARDIGMEDTVLRPEERCISPSDFGFHNAIVDAECRLRFFDFEYAGWDDPAKLACDFFCQVEVPAPPDDFKAFVTDMAAALFHPPAMTCWRAERLAPAYQIKWCCILLNEFLPQPAQRRRFSQGDCADDRKAEQLAKAREMQAKLE